MSDSYVQVPTDSTGKKLRTRKNTVGVDDVHSEVVVLEDNGGNLVTVKDINRLISSWWPTGRILFQDDMESLPIDPITITPSTILSRWVSDNQNISRSSERTFHGQYSLKLTTGPTAGNQSDATLYFGLPKYLTKLGVELKWLSPASVNKLRSLKVAMTYYDGVNHHQGAIYYRGHEGGFLYEKWRYLNSGSGFTDLFTQHIYMTGAEAAWNGLKLIIDFENNKFFSFKSNELSADMSSIPLQYAASTIIPLLGIYLQITTDVDESIWAYIDDLIFTDEGV